MDAATEQRLRTYIDAELKDSMVYKELANKAPNNTDKKILLEMSADEKTHAERFQQIYKKMTGKSYNPVIKPPVLTGSYKDILRERVLDESADYRKYGQQYLLTENNMALKYAYYLAHLDENVHALRLLYLLSK